MTYLLDTNIISEIRKAHGNPHVKAWFAATGANDLYLSVLTIGEIRHGIERLRRRDATQASVFDSWLAGLQREFDQRLLPVSVQIADVWGQLRVPDPVPTIDGLLAATASVTGLTLVTRNTSDLANTGVRLLNPFE